MKKQVFHTLLVGAAMAITMLGCFYNKGKSAAQPFTSEQKAKRAAMFETIHGAKFFVEDKAVVVSITEWLKKSSRNNVFTGNSWKTYTNIEGGCSRRTPDGFQECRIF